MNKLKYYSEVAAISLGIAALIYGCFYVDFYLWRMEHPTTPVWVYIIRSGK